MRLSFRSILGLAVATLFGLMTAFLAVSFTSSTRLYTDGWDGIPMKQTHGSVFVQDTSMMDQWQVVSNAAYLPRDRTKGRCKLPEPESTITNSFNKSSRFNWSRLRPCHPA